MDIELLEKKRQISIRAKINYIKRKNDIIKQKNNNINVKKKRCNIIEEPNEFNVSFVSFILDFNLYEYEYEYEK